MTDEAGWVALGVKPVLDRGFSAGFSRDLDPALAGVARSSGSRFGTVLGKAAVVGAAGIIGAGVAAFRFGKDALGEAREAQEVGRTSAAILKATGGAAKLTGKEYDSLTDALMRKTAIDDEQIAMGGNLLLTFKNVKREGKGLKDIFGRALASSLDLAAAGFGSIESTSKQLGKALNDPVKGMSALNKAGVTFTQDQQDTIKSLVATGDLLKAQKIILGEVESQVGGTAAAQKTSAKELEVAWGNLKEEIGGALIPVIDDLAGVMLDKGIPAGERFSDWLRKDGIPQVKDFGNKVGPLVHEVLPALGTVLGDVRDVLAEAAPYAADLVGAFNSMPGWAKKAVVGGGLGLFAASKLPKGGSGGLLGGLTGKASPVPVIVTNLPAGGLGGSDGTVITDGEGKPSKGKKPRKGIKGAGLFVGTALATLFGDDIVKEAKDELLFPTTEDGKNSIRDLVGPLGGSSLNHLLGLGLDVDGGVGPSQGAAKQKRDLGNLLLDPIREADDFLSRIERRKIEPAFALFGLTDAENRVDELRRKASQPIHMPVIIDAAGNTHSSLGGHSTDVPGETVAGSGRVGGITVNGGMHVVAHDYRDMQRQLQRRAQQAGLGGIGVLSS